jgi:hypothetical protein
MLPLQIFKLGKIAGLDRKRKYPRRHDLQFLAHGVNLRDFLRREVTNDCAAIGYARNDAFLLKLKKRQTDIAAVRLEAVAEVLLDETLARMASAEHDVFFEARRNPIGNSPLLICWLGTLLRVRRHGWRRAALGHYCFRR